MTARSPWLVLAIVSTALFLIVIDMTVLYTALPTLTRDLDASATEKLWIVNAYSLVVAGLLPGAGALGDRFGHRRMFMIGLVIFGLASLAAGFAPSSAMLIAARAALAVGAAGPVAGLLLGRVRAGVLLSATLAISGTGILIYWAGFGQTWVELASFAIMGAGIGAAMTAASSAIMLNAPADRAGMAASVEEVSYELGGALGIAMLGSLMAGVYSASFAAAGGSGAQARDSLDGALALAATLPAPQADTLLALANAAFDRATGAVALAAGLVLLGAALWIGRINRAGRTIQQSA